MCLSVVFRVCEVADKKTIKHDKPRNINEYSRCTPDIPKINKHVCSFRAVCRCWPNIGPSLPMSEDVPGKINVYRFSICGCTYETCRFSHRAPQSGQCKLAFTSIVGYRKIILLCRTRSHDVVQRHLII